MARWSAGRIGAVLGIATAIPFVWTIASAAINGTQAQLAVPAKLDSLTIQHDTQISVSREERDYLRALLCVQVRSPAKRDDCLRDPKFRGIR